MPEKCKAAGKWLTVLSLCGALGLHWFALQTVAWVGMLINYSHGAAVSSAIEMTFDGRHPCPLCKAISRGEQGGKKQEFQAAGKIDMDFVKVAELPAPLARDFAWPAFLAAGCGFQPEPIVPPPRVA